MCLFILFVVLVGYGFVCLLGIWVFAWLFDCLSARVRMFCRVVCLFFLVGYLYDWVLTSVFACLLAYFRDCFGLIVCVLV